MIYDTTLWVSGGSSAFRKSIWDSLGGLYRIYNPFYWEDIDLSYRAQKAGYTVRFESESKVIHEHEKGSIKKQFSSSRIRAVSYRNQFLFVWINITEPRFLVSHVLWLPVHSLQALLRQDRAFFQGLLYAFLKFPEAMRLRRHNLKHSVVSDEEVLTRAK